MRSTGRVGPEDLRHPAALRGVVDDHHAELVAARRNSEHDVAGATGPLLIWWMSSIPGCQPEMGEPATSPARAVKLMAVQRPKDKNHLFIISHPPWESSWCEAVELQPSLAGTNTP